MSSSDTKGDVALAYRAAAKMSSALAEGSDHGGRGGRLPLFDGTGDYDAWRDAVTVDALYADDGKAFARSVLQALRGAPVKLATKGVKAAYVDYELILAKLDPVYAGTSQENAAEAWRQLARCRQGTGSLEDFIEKVSSLSASAEVDDRTRVSFLQAGVSSRLAQTAATLTGKSFPDAARTLRIAEDMLPRSTFQPKGGKSGKTTRGRQTGTRDLSNVTCFRCNKKGHLQASCKDTPAKGKKAGAGSPDDDDDIEEYQGNE